MYIGISISALYILVDNYVPSIPQRSRYFIAFASGLRVIDFCFPVAAGQRELIIGDRQTGKSAII